MKTEQLLKLIVEMGDLIKFHELETVDSKAVDLLLQAQDAVRSTPADHEDGGEFEQWMEKLRVANSCELS